MQLNKSERVSFCSEPSSENFHHHSCSWPRFKNFVFFPAESLTSASPALKSCLRAVKRAGGPTPVNKTLKSNLRVSPWNGSVWPFWMPLTADALSLREIYKMMRMWRTCEYAPAAHSYPGQVLAFTAGYISITAAINSIQISFNGFDSESRMQQ